MYFYLIGTIGPEEEATIWCHEQDFSKREFEKIIMGILMEIYRKEKYVEMIFYHEDFDRRLSEKGFFRPKINQRFTLNYLESQKLMNSIKEEM